MKKLMVAVALVCAAAFAEAAAVNWDTGVNYWNGAGNAVATSTGTKLGKDAVTGYLWILKDKAAYDLACAAIQAQDTAMANYAKGQITAGGAADSKNTGKAGTLSFSDGVTYADEATVYGLIVCKTTQGGIDYYYANVATATAGTTDVTVQELASTLGGTSSASTSAIKWQAAGSTPPTPTPEPTSGLLLVLGMAGLALRRKRA